MIEHAWHAHRTITNVEPAAQKLQVRLRPQQPLASGLPARRTRLPEAAIPHEQRDADAASPGAPLVNHVAPAFERRSG